MTRSVVLVAASVCVCVCVCVVCMCVCACVPAYMCVHVFYVRVRVCAFVKCHMEQSCQCKRQECRYGVATISRLPQNIGLFRKNAL